MKVDEIVLIELLLTPLLIVSVTLIEKRFGERVSGFVVGMPLTTGPVILALYLKFDENFARLSLSGVMVSIASTVTFCVVYYMASSIRNSYLISIVTSLLAFALSAALLRSLDLPFLIESLVAFLALLLGTLFKGKAVQRKPVRMRFLYNLTFRVAAATSLVFLVTSFSGYLGPLLSGIVSNTPVFISTFVVFNHALGDRQMAQNFLAGTLKGSFSYFLFFLVLAVTLPIVNAWVSFASSTVAALLLNLALYQFVQQSES